MNAGIKLIQMSYYTTTSEVGAGVHSESFKKALSWEATLRHALVDFAKIFVRPDITNLARSLQTRHIGKVQL